MSTMQPLTRRSCSGYLSRSSPHFSGRGVQLQPDSLRSSVGPFREIRLEHFGVATPVRTSPTPLGCLYIVDGRVHLITSVAPDTKTIERVMGIESGTDRATRWTAISVAGSAGFSQSVVTSVGSGIELVIRKDDDLVGAEVIARVNPRAKAIAVLNVIGKQV